MHLLLGVYGCSNFYSTTHMSFATAMLEWYKSNPRMEHWKVVKKVLWYLEGTKDHMLTYKKSD